MTPPSVLGLKIGIAVTYLIAFGAIALYDQPLDPELARIVTTVPKAADSNNLFLAMIGFNAPPGSDPTAFGRNRLTTAQTADDSRDLKMKGKFPGPFYSSPLTGLASFARSQAIEADRLVRENGELLSRYRGLRGYDEYAEFPELSFNMPIPNYTLISNAQQLEHIRILRSSDRLAALTALQGDMKFWRGYAAQAQNVIGKLTAFRNIGRIYSLVAELAAERTYGAAELEIVKNDLLRPLSAVEAGMGPTLAAEAAALYHYFNSGIAPARQNLLARSVMPFVLKTNCTSNLAFANLAPALHAEKLPATDYARIAAAPTPPLPSGRFGDSPTSLVNPLGHIMLDIASPSFTAMVSRRHNSEGLRRLALLQLEIASRRVSPEGMPTFLARTGAELANPYTGKPMEWDPAQRMLLFPYPTTETAPTPVRLYTSFCDSAAGCFYQKPKK